MKTDVYKRQIETDIEGMVKLVRESSDIPCAIGFGIAAPEQAKAMAALPDGAIVCLLYTSAQNKVKCQAFQQRRL